jgi:hypothetical protein
MRNRVVYHRRLSPDPRGAKTIEAKCARRIINRVRLYRFWKNWVGFRKTDIGSYALCAEAQQVKDHPGKLKYRLDGLGLP